MKLKITSDGSVANSKVVNVETGETLPNVTAVEWSHAAGGVPIARISLLVTQVELIGETPEELDKRLKGESSIDFSLKEGDFCKAAHWEGANGAHGVVQIIDINWALRSAYVDLTPFDKRRNGILWPVYGLYKVNQHGAPL